MVSEELLGYTSASAIQCLKKLTHLAPDGAQTSIISILYLVTGASTIMSGVCCSSQAKMLCRRLGLLALPSAPIPTPPKLSARLPLFHIRIVTTFFSICDSNERICILDAIRRGSTAATDLIWTRRGDVAVSTLRYRREGQRARIPANNSPTCADQVRYGGNRAALQHQAAMFQKSHVRMPKRGCLIVGKATRASGMIYERRQSLAG